MNLRYLVYMQHSNKPSLILEEKQKRVVVTESIEGHSLIAAFVNYGQARAYARQRQNNSNALICITDSSGAIIDIFPALPLVDVGGV